MEKSRRGHRQDNEMQMRTQREGKTGKREAKERSRRFYGEPKGGQGVTNTKLTRCQRKANKLSKRGSRKFQGVPKGG
jgi:hypothetical protein